MSLTEEEVDFACRILYRESLHGNAGYHWPGDSPRENPNIWAQRDGVHETVALDPNDPGDARAMSALRDQVRRFDAAITAAKLGG